MPATTPPQPASRKLRVNAMLLRDAEFVVQFSFVTYSQVSLEKLDTPNTTF